MTDLGSVSRLRNAGLSRILTGYDFLLSLVVTLCIYFTDFDILTNFNATDFVSQSTSLAVSLIGFIIAGVAILVALSDEKFLLYLKKNGVYGNLLFVFEYTVLLAIFVSFIGIVLQSYSFGRLEFHIFLFFFMYLLFSTVYLVSNIISFGDKKGDKILTEGLSDLMSQLESEDFVNDSDELEAKDDNDSMNE